jgi:hypothetical protein
MNHGVLGNNSKINRKSDGNFRSRDATTRGITVSNASYLTSSEHFKNDHTSKYNRASMCWRAAYQNMTAFEHHQAEMNLVGLRAYGIKRTR